MVSRRQAQGKTGKSKLGKAEQGRTPTPIPISRWTRTLLIFGGIAAVLLIAYFAPSALYIIIGGFALALILSFPVRALSHLMPRPLAILVTYLALIGLVVLAFIILVPLLIDQLGGLIGEIPGFARSADQFVNSLLQPLAERNLLSGASPDEVVSDLVNRVSGSASGLAENFLGGLVGVVSGTVSFAVILIGALFVSVYLLLDVRRIKAAYLRALPHAYRWDGRELWDSFRVSLSHYIGGLAFVVLIQGALTAIALSLIGIPYAILLGAWVSVTAIIPYIGAFLGAIPGVIVALFISPTVAVVTALVYLAIQQLEGNFLTPRIQGQALRVHPIIVLLAVVVGGALAGLVGVIVAVPTLAVLRVLFDFFRMRLRTEE